jgi:hypothetical protein
MIERGRKIQILPGIEVIDQVQERILEEKNPKLRAPVTGSPADRFGLPIDEYGTGSSYFTYVGGLGDPETPETDWDFTNQRVVFRDPRENQEEK